MAAAAAGSYAFDEDVLEVMFAGRRAQVFEGIARVDFPPCKIAMRSQSFSASLMIWVEKMIALPSARNSAITFCISTALSTSSPTVGFVKIQDGWVMRDRAGQGHLLFHALGEFVHARLGVIADAKALDEIVHPRLNLLAREAVDAGEKIGVQQDRAGEDTTPSWKN